MKPKTAIENVDEISNNSVKKKPSRIQKSNETWIARKEPNKPKKGHPWHKDKIFNTQIERDPDAIN